MIYLITFACYGTHLHGDEPGSVDRDHNLPGSREVEPHAGRLSVVRHVMKQPAYSLDEPRRNVVLSALVERCAERGWSLTAAHVRTNHVHVVIAGEVPPERIMNDLKSYASRILNRAELDAPDRKRWARHGSTRWLWDRKSVLAAITYVADKQGEPMALFVAAEHHGIT